MIQIGDINMVYFLACCSRILRAKTNPVVYPQAQADFLTLFAKFWRHSVMTPIYDTTNKYASEIQPLSPNSRIKGVKGVVLRKKKLVQAGVGEVARKEGTDSRDVATLQVWDHVEWRMKILDEK